eukprot:m.27040 g.27040  ORF g.27040 m.27040 type:complete len:843 (-) comp4370_c1_seq1:1004-3532(-)
MDTTDMNTPRAANVFPMDILTVFRPYRGVSGEGIGAASTGGDGPASPDPANLAVLRVTVRAAEIAQSGGALFRKAGDPMVTLQLMRSQVGDTDDVDTLLSDADKIGPELKTDVIKRRRSARWDTADFGLQWLKDPSLYAHYFVLVTLWDMSRREPREVGHQAIRFVNLPITMEDAGTSVFQAQWTLRRFRSMGNGVPGGSPPQQQAAGTIEMNFSFDPPQAYVRPQSPPQSPRRTTVLSPELEDRGEGAAHAQDATGAGPAVMDAGADASDDVTAGSSNTTESSGSGSGSGEGPLTTVAGGGGGGGGGANDEWRVNTSAVAALPNSEDEPPSAGAEITSRCPLPPGWVMCRTKKGRPFFVDHTTKKTTFEDPRRSDVYASFYARRMRDQMQPRFSSVVVTSPREETIPLPPNWDERYDVDGRKFYVDHAKKKTTWVHPVTGKKSRKEDPAALAAAAKGKLAPDFNRKLKKFRQALKEMRGPAADKQNILISRSDVLNTSLQTVMQLGPKDLQKTPYVTFFGERGLDYGGLQREWFYLLSHDIFNPAYGLFEYSSGDSYILQANPNSGLANPGHLHYFRFSGRILGMAVLHGGQIDAFFIKPVYKFLLGLPITVEDMMSVDPEYYKNLLYVLQNDPAPLNLTFSIDEEGIGETREVDLKENGSQIDVTVENRDEYVQLVCERRFVERCRNQMDALRQGFSEVVPRRLISAFDANELEVLIGGTAAISVQDWRKNTVYSGGYTTYSPTVQWFWEAVLSYTPEQRARLLQFATASSRVPMNGFAELQGSNGPQRFNIRQWGCIKDLPRAHTCFNRIDLPAYNSFKLTKEKLLLAIENTEGFDGVD